MSGKAIAFEVAWHMAGDEQLSPKELIDGEERTFGEGKVQSSASVSRLKEMRVGSAGEAWRLMLQKGALTAFPLAVVLLGGPIGLGCHFCYLILCMWTRLGFLGCWGLSREMALGGGGSLQNAGMSL